MPKLFGVDIASVLNRELAPGLLDGTLYVDTGGVRDPLNPTAGAVGGSAEVHTFKGIINFYRDNEVDEELILHSDRKILIVAKSINPTVVPEKGMRVSMSDDPRTSYQIVRVNRDPASATYICQGRS